MLALFFKLKQMLLIMSIIKCAKCGEEKEHQAKGLCFNCYRKFCWKQKNIVCKRCGRELPNHAKGLCAGCYQFVFNSERNKAWNYKSRHNINLELYKKITQICIICGFNKIVDLHHLDENKANNSESNLVGLCPNHHKMLHDFRYKQEMFNLLKEKGFNVTEDKKMQFKK